MPERLRISEMTPEQQARRRARNLRYVHAKRLRYRQAGLNAEGKPRKEDWTVVGTHPQGCPCYDCLWTVNEKPQVYTRPVCRVHYAH